jgi:hypothetical protein
MNYADISRLTDDELWTRAKSLARAERASTCDLVEHLAEIDRRDLHTRREYTSLFEYCVHCLGFSDDAAYRRIRAARAIRKFPPILDFMREGRLTLENVALLHPHLDDPDAATLVEQCLGLRKWQAQVLVAGRQIENKRRDVIRFCGSPPPPPIATAAETPLLNFVAAESTTAITAPEKPPAASRQFVSPSRAAAPKVRTVRVSFSADAEFYALMQRARALLRHKYPDGRLEGVLKDALAALLAKKDRGFGWTGRRGRG